jgi:hypothetical protein
MSVGDERPDIAQLFASPAVMRCGFSALVNLRQLPQRDLVISACTVDTDCSIAYLLANTYTLGAASDLIDKH